MKPFFFPFFLLAGLSVSVQAAPTQWTVDSGGNGHWYEFVSGSPNWESALTSAAARTHLGLNGYLATITSAVEDSFIKGIAGGGIGWTGGTDKAQEGTWLWATGPEAGTVFWTNGSTQTYANWNKLTGEPNNVGNEDYLVVKQLPGWNDAPTNFAKAYYVEFSAPVPEPETFALLLAGLGLIGFVARRKTNESKGGQGGRPL